MSRVLLTAAWPQNVLIPYSTARQQGRSTPKGDFNRQLRFVQTSVTSCLTPHAWKRYHRNHYGTHKYVRVFLVRRQIVARLAQSIRGGKRRQLRYREGLTLGRTARRSTGRPRS